MALVVFQMPPLVAPAKRMSGSAGWAATVWIAPDTSSDGLMFSTCPLIDGPGPWATQVPPPMGGGVGSGSGANAAPLSRSGVGSPRGKTLAGGSSGGC